MEKYQSNVQNRKGDAVAGASVRVVTYPAGAIATIYSDNGITPAANPLTTDSNGAFSFYAADGRYSLEVSGNGIASLTLSDITIAEDLPPGKQGTATLVAGSAVVSNSSITANSRVFLTSNVDGGTPGFLRVSARTPGVSFTITSSSGTDTSTVAYQFYEP